MTKNTFEIGKKTLLWISIILVLTTFSILSVNHFDKKRKFNQFQELHSALSKSNYPNRFQTLTENYNSKDSSQIQSISENLYLLNQEELKINYSNLLIVADSVYYWINAYNNKVSTTKYLTLKNQEIINYLKLHQKPDLEQLFNLNSSSSNLKVMIKVSENCFLEVIQNRN